MKRSTLAVVVGASELAVLVAVVPLVIVDHQNAFSGYFSGGVAMLSFVLVGTLVAHRCPALRMGWIMLAVSGAMGLSGLGEYYSVLDYRLHGGRLPLGWIALLIEPCWVPAFAALIAAIVVYPSGRAPSVRWRWLLRLFVALLSAWAVGNVVLITSVVIDGRVRVERGGDLYQYDHPTGVWSVLIGSVVVLLTVAVLAIIGGWIVRQVVGYRRLDGDRRVQQKWIISGAVIAIAAFLTNILPYPFSSATAQLSIADFASVGLAALPVAMGVGILRFRLYEIDRIVSRTVSYAVVSALLVGTFVGLVALTTDLLSFSSTVGVAASTLAAAALFNPVRVRVQRVVDRRFNRARYDAEATVVAFAARLRDAVELESIQSDLIAVVNAAVEPAHTSVWIRGGLR